MHAAFQVPYVYDYITKLCRRQAEIIHNHENEYVCNIGQGETPHRKYKSQYNMLMSPMGLRSERGCAGDARQKLKTIDPTSRQRGLADNINKHTTV
jgi:hypothetical protein